MDFEQELVGSVPRLRSFARSFVHDPARADDLVQETLAKAWKARASFTAGTYLNAWLFTILRNVHYSENRKRRREVEDPDEKYQLAVATPPEQHAHVELADLRRALNALPPDQREALFLVGGEGFSYEETAQICRRPIGTIKSRVNRARTRLLALLGDDARGERYVTGYA
jgi:RNA polymerase sigma-70 factor (ECF subfamily)